MRKRWLALILMMTVFCGQQAGAAESANPQAQRRGFRTQKQGGGRDVFTLMFYMCGSDLESEAGAATGDLNEILHAGIGENVNIIIETGGAKTWKNSNMDSGQNQRWRASNTGLEHLENAGLRDMTDPATLTSFIRYCAENYPANRYALILWDHGGGTLGGFAVDEHFPNSESMGINQMNRALTDAGVKFDFIGFDACLMATAETAFMVERHADYMIASQRVEPGDGWYYTNWISALSDDPSIDTLVLGRMIVDDFISTSKSGYYGNELTLSVIDLTYVGDLFHSLYGYFSSVKSALVNDAAFSQVSQARYDSRTLTSNYDQVDIAYLVSNMEVAESAALMESLRRCVAYNNATIANHAGLCLYFPYTNLNEVSKALHIYNAIGIDESYQSFISTFSSLMVGGQAHGGGGSGSGSGNPYGGEAFDADFWMALDWVDPSLIDEYSGYYDETSFDGELEIHEKGDTYALSLTDEDWDTITHIELQVYLDDGEGYIELGTDNLYSFDEDGDMIVEFDNQWLALDGQTVSYRAVEAAEEDGGWYSWGIVPAELNGREIEIIVMWDDENPDGYVAGARCVYEGPVSGKGLFDLSDGDELRLLCDYYTYDEEYDDQYYWGELTVDGELTVSYEDVGDGECLVYYLLYDIYQNTYWTEPVVYSAD